MLREKNQVHKRTVEGKRVKWFTHDNDLHKWPPMQGIIAELGWAGYGRALAVLETLAKYVANDGKRNFILPLAKPMDINYWARELGQSVENTERMFDVFQSVALIQPWRETKAICAPMLGDRVDEWTKRKRKERKRSKKLAGAGLDKKRLAPPAQPLLPEHSNQQANQQEHQNLNEHENKNKHEHQHKHNCRATTESLGSSDGSNLIDGIEVAENDLPF